MFQNLFSFLGLENRQLTISNEQLSICPIKIILFFIHYQLLITTASAQKPQGKFLTDSIEVGKPVSYTLSYRHNPMAEVFFPDTTHNFYPFELVKRDYFPTKTDARGSLDSVIYTLVSFEIQPIQKLAVPIYVLNQQDCTAIYSHKDSVYLKEMIKGSLDSLSLKTDIRFVHLEPKVNYPQILAYLLGIFGVGGVIYLIFGKSIRKQYRLFLFGRKHNEFVSSYKKIIKGSLDDKNIGKAVVLWKKHLEWLEKKPYTSYTTKEITARLPSESLSDALRDVDTAIYGGILSTQMPFAMNVLLNTAVELYKNRREELKYV